MRSLVKQSGLAILGATFTLAVNAAPRYAADVPAGLLTPDAVETGYLGRLEFNDGFPTDGTVDKVYSFLDTSRAVELFLNAMPATSMYAMLQGHVAIGVRPNRDVGVTEQLMDAQSLWLTPNTSTPYVHGEIDVKDGPVVIEIGSPVLGIIDDAFFRYVSDLGVTGPDKGKGGKYLVLGADYAGTVPAGYHLIRTSTYRHWMLLRLVVQNGDVDAAVRAFKSGFRMYPLAEAAKPGKTAFVNLSGKQYNTIHANDVSYFDELNAVIQYEPAGSYDPEITGMATSLGIEKGKAFAPDARMQGILKEAAAIANASAVREAAHSSL